MAFPKILVKVSNRIAAYGGVLYDYNQDVNIGSEPVEVEPTNLIMKWLSRGELVVVDPPQAAKEGKPKPEWPKGMRLDVIKVFEDMGMNADDVKAMTDEEILSIRGIGNKTLKHIKEVME